MVRKLLVEGTDYTLTYSATSLTVTLNGGLAGKGYQVTYDRTINKPSDSLSYMSTQAYTVGDAGTLSSNSAYVYLTMTNYKHLEKKLLTTAQHKVLIGKLTLTLIKTKYLLQQCLPMF